MRRPARMPVLHLLVLVAACDVNLFLTVVCFVKKSPGLSWDFGAYVSVAAAVAATCRRHDEPAASDACAQRALRQAP